MSKLNKRSAGIAMSIGAGIAALVLLVATRSQWPHQIPRSGAAVDGQSQSGASAQPNAEQELRELCQQVRCYPPGAVHVTLDGGEVATLDSEYPLPIVSNSTIFIFPGATLYVAGKLEGGRLVGLTAVDEPPELHNVFKLEMWQEANKPATFLKVTNYFDLPVKYRAGMRLPDKPDFVPTSNCPVTAKGGSAEERWPHAIFQLALLQFEVLGAAESAACE